jgi:hypothetical protein
MHTHTHTHTHNTHPAVEMKNEPGKHLSHGAQVLVSCRPHPVQTLVLYSSTRQLEQGRQVRSSAEVAVPSTQGPELMYSPALQGLQGLQSLPLSGSKLVPLQQACMYCPGGQVAVHAAHCVVSKVEVPLQRLVMYEPTGHCMLQAAQTLASSGGGMVSSESTGWGGGVVEGISVVAVVVVLLWLLLLLLFLGERRRRKCRERPHGTM